MENQKVYSKKDVSYRKYKEGDEGNCASCRFFIKNPMLKADACELVKGKIKGTDTCNLWSGANDSV